MNNSHARVNSEQIDPQVQDTYKVSKKELSKTVISNPLSNAEVPVDTSLQTED